MRAVIQRVKHAEVRVAGKVVGAIDRGLLVLVAAATGDSEADARALADKLTGLRVFVDDEGKMNRSVSEAGGSMLVVSQFTLYADLRRGRRPSFTSAAPPDVAEPLVEALIGRLGRSVPVASGRFGAMMEVELINDGPVTIVVDVVDGRVI
ncbi:MAG: D-aminoacyl-tRNA deacylase [Acidimicrobiia bacterium]|nr:D-aminoacyl-tRNA deacylase [Acidimicrobiia bacterium]